jgi:ribosomal protein S27AE
MLRCGELGVMKPHRQLPARIARRACGRGGTTAIPTTTPGSAARARG